VPTFSVCAARVRIAGNPTTAAPARAAAPVRSLRRPKALAGFLVADCMVMIALPFIGRFGGTTVPRGYPATGN
jgi:hypothetical protein